MEPKNGAYIDSLGWAYYKKGMLDEAQEQIQKALKYMPDDAVIRDHLGDVFFAKGEFGKAREEWRVSIDLDPGRKEVSDKLNKLKRKKR